MRITLLALILFAFSCQTNSVVLEKTNASGEVPALANLTFRFSNALAADSMLNQWDSTEYVSFSPVIHGRFRWEEPDLLIFSPSGKLPPATSFTARVTSKVLAASAFGHIKNGTDIKFFTPSLKVIDVNASWVLQDEQAKLAVPQLDVYFNYPVSPADIKNKIVVQAEGKPVPFSVQTLSDDSHITLRIARVAAQDKDLQVAVTLLKGVVPKGGENATSNDVVSYVKIPSPYNLVINDVTAEHDGLAGTVQVRTSQQMVMENIVSSIKIEPAVKFSVESTDEGFIIRSEAFNANKSYLLTLNKGLRGKVGGVLQEEFDNNIAFGELEPSLKFSTAKSVYLSSKGNQMIEMSIVNVPKIKVIVSKIYESNLLTAQHVGYDPKDKNEEYGYDYPSVDMQMGDVMYEQEIDTRSLPMSGNRRLFTFNVDDRLPGFRGIYHIKVRSAKDYWISDSRFISVSDIGLIAKEGKDKLMVFANSIRTADAINSVNIVAYGNNNQVLGMGVTNADGVAEIKYTRKDFEGFRPAMVVAKTDNDFNYLPFGDTRVNMSRFETGGKQMNNSGLDAFIYPERDIYRPGEKVNFGVLIRDKQWKVPGRVPVKIKFLLPNGKELKTFRKTLNEQGSTEGNIDLAVSAITGTYTAEIYTSNDVLLGSKNFSIEEFVPDRIKVSATLDKDMLQPGATAILSVNAINFFGPPASNRKFETEVHVAAKDFISKKYPGYDFSIQNSGLSLDKVVKEGTTDANGNGTMQYEVPKMFADNGLLQANFYTTVFDETGRPVSRKVEAKIYTQPIFLGIANDDNWYFPLNQPLRFTLIAMNPEGSVLQAAKAVVKMIRHEYKTVLSKSGSYFRYDSQENDKLLSEQMITINGDKSYYSFVPRVPGNYEIRVLLPGATTYVSRKFYSYGSWGGDNNSFEVNTEGNIDIESDKSVYRQGESAKLLFKTPFDGKLLVTMENENVISYKYVNVENRNASLELPISAEHLPNVFVSATLFKAHGISDIPLTVAHGFQNLKVEEAKRIDKVEIYASKTSRSKTRQQITVRAAPGSYVTLAAVDNGVLQVTDFKSPDPYVYFYSPRALHVSSYDLYPLLFPEVRAKLSSTGGDMDADLQKRMNPMPSKRIKIVSYWSGIARTNGGGEAKFSIDIPQFSGQIRLMAVAYRDNLFGSAETTITVSDPVVLSTALPRFLSPGDTVRVPITVSNTTASARNATATIRVSGPVKAIGTIQQSLTIPANSETRIQFSVVASHAIDTGRVVVDVLSASEKYSEETSIGVRPSSPLQIITGTGVLNGGSTQTISIPNADFLAGSARYKLVISRNPLLEQGKHFETLLDYPYGCTEQVVSAAFPQLYYNDLSNVMNLRQPGSTAANQNVMEAIRKIRLRQLYNGALTLWDGEGTENWWCTAYAAHFLLEAQKAGFDVDNNLLNGLLEFINNRLRKKETITYYYNRDQKKKIAPKEIAYSLYVLALAGRPNVAAMNYYKAAPALLSLDAKYLLSVAYAVAGDKKRFADMLPSSFSGEESVPQTGGSFYSPIRDEAISLSALLDADPGNAQIPYMARHLNEQLAQRSWYSTQESAFSLLALGKFARTFPPSEATADISMAGKPATKFDGQDLTLSGKPSADNRVSIAVRGKGKLYYYWQSEGISASGKFTGEDKFIRVRRQFFDRNGRKLEGSDFHQNDLVIVQLTLERLYNGDIENIVISDLLPAAFEIENPRTKEIPGMEWIKDGSQPSSIDIRDDRINLFADLRSAKQVYYYAVRVVSTGTFTLAPAAADAMYNGEYHSYNGGGTIRVVP